MSKLKAQRDAFGEALLEVGEKNRDVCVLNADVGSPTRTKKFKEIFPERSYDIGIAEENGISTAAGMALGGLRPFFVSFGVFTASNYDQIRMSVGYSKAPVVLVGTHGGLIGKDGASHQALEDINLLSALPGMSIYQPADLNETKKIVHHLANSDETAYLRISRHPQENVLEENQEFIPGKASPIYLTENPEGCIFTTGYLSTHSLEVAKMLFEAGHSFDVINFSTLHPEGIDRETILKYAKDKKPIVTVEDHCIYGGLGSRVSEVIAEEGLGSKVLRIGTERFGKSGSPEKLYEMFGLDAKGIEKKIRENYSL